MSKSELFEKLHDKWVKSDTLDSFEIFCYKQGRQDMHDELQATEIKAHDENVIHNFVRFMKSEFSKDITDYMNLYFKNE